MIKKSTFHTSDNQIIKPNPVTYYKQIIPSSMQPNQEKYKTQIDEQEWTDRRR